jgi:hypothetical protein
MVNSLCLQEDHAAVAPCINFVPSVIGIGIFYCSVILSFRVNSKIPKGESGPRD